VIYWTAVIWIPILSTKNFVTAGFFGWCIGCMGMFSVMYTLKEGKYPSGATSEKI